MAPGYYRERLTVSLGWWLLGGLFVVAVWWAFFVATPLVAAVVAGLVTLVLVGWALFHYGSLTIGTGLDGLRVGRASLPWSSIGPVTALDADQTRRRMGVEADARAFLVTRAYVAESVMIEVCDNIDPTPYWLVSSRRPHELAEHLTEHAGQD
jgi:hypothetical protein